MFLYDVVLPNVLSLPELFPFSLKAPIFKIENQKRNFLSVIFLCIIKLYHIVYQKGKGYLRYKEL